MKKIPLFISLITFLTIISVGLVRAEGTLRFYDGCNNITQWHENSGGMTIDTINSSISLNGSTCRLTAADGKIMSYNFSNASGNQLSSIGSSPFNVSYWFNLTNGGANDVYISVTSSSETPHWRDGATLIYRPGVGLQAINNSADLYTNLLSEAAFTNGNKVKITIELNDSVVYGETGRLHYNVYVNDVLNKTALAYYAQSVNIVDRRDLGSIGVTVVGGHTLYLDDIQVFNASSIPTGLIRR